MLSNGFLIDLQLSLVALWLVYYFALHRRVSIAVARIFLLMIMPMAVAVSVIKVPVFTRTNYKTEAVSTNEVSYADVIHTLDRSEALYPMTLNSDPTETPSHNLANNAVEITPPDIILWLYIAGAVAISLWTLIGVIRIYTLIRKSDKIVIMGQRVIFASGRCAAYSFLGYIVINDKYRNSSSILKSIVLHEKFHSRCHHAHDLIYMVVVRTLLWFNPAIWHMLKLLRQLHEYEVDRMVVASGAPLADYMSLLIDADYGKAPILSHSLSYSLTKKRLLMITHTFNQYSALRIVLAAPVIAILICAFSLTSRAEVVIVESGTEVTTGVDKTSASIVSNAAIGREQENSVVYAASITYKSNSIPATYTEITEYGNRQSHTLNLHTTIFPEQSADGRPAVVLAYNYKDFPNKFQDITHHKLDRRFLSSIAPSFVESIEILSRNEARARFRTSSKDSVILITLTPNSEYQYMDLVRHMYDTGGSGYANFSNMSTNIHPTIIFNKADGELIPARYPNSGRYEDVIKRVNAKYLDGVEHLNAKDAVRRFGVAGINGTTTVSLRQFDGSIADIIPTNRAMREEDQPFSFIDRFDCYTLKADQISISDTPYNGVKYGKVLKVRHTDTETFVTIALPISWNLQWHGVNNNTALLDTKTGDRYHFRRMDNNIPSDKLLIINNMKGKILELTQVFPRIKDGVKSVTLIEVKPQDKEFPRNFSGFISYTINLNDFPRTATVDNIY